MQSCARLVSLHWPPAAVAAEVHREVDCQSPSAMGVSVVPLLASLLSIMIALPHSYTFTVSLRPTKFAGSRLENPDLQPFESKLSLIRSASLCAMKDWCLLHCSTDSGLSTLMNTIVVPFNEDPEGPPWMKCFTKRSPSNILTAQSGIKVYDASPVARGQTARIPENLLDGIHDGSVESCYKSIDDAQPFVVFDLVSVRYLNGVSVMAQSNGFYKKYFNELDIRIGTSPASGDFENYTQMSYYPGPPPHDGYELIVQPAEPIAGRYLAIRKTPNEAGVSLQICHVEIYV